MAPRSWELIGLSLLAGLGLGLALDRGDLIFVAVFGAVGGMAIIGGMQHFPSAHRERHRDPSLLPALAEPQFHVAIADPGGREEGERDAELSRFCAPLLYNISGVP